MSLNLTDVEKIAHLARIALTPQEAAELGGSLSGILDFVEQMAAVDTSGLSPMAHPLHMAQRLRADVVTEQNQRERFQSIAPATQNGLYLVPRVIE
ncbi:MAG: Asp-tRNA(Asn)/Glu-tRNA(Gln) amidotransferase subunit GatC [Gammaproteobacteria bacterium SHHR-1]|uniref:Asp-tRNA(Asn)/Glu-tRNA(Gln) amidotransferase subunit GatC n=1 Tax=Magnetovirga frankeli TaxID=947516 RepID=UPI0012931016|nr:Asp-tRNA(Asn)/Glu-tRNA(Gln) amidotransferase subunit GatC [gamma proteobacterium SS-5]